MRGLSFQHVVRVHVPVDRSAFANRRVRFTARTSAILLAIVAVPLVLNAQTAGKDSNSPRDSRASSSATVTSPSLNTAANPSPQEYPEEKSKTKLEAVVGAIKLRFYGTVLFNMSFSDSDEVGQEVPLWPLPGIVPITFPDGTTVPAGHVHDTVFTARQSIFGFNFAPAKTSDNGWNPSAVIEMDFFGTRPSDLFQPQGRVFNQPRLRKGYLQLEKGNFKVVAGQDDMIISPLDPISLSHVGVPLGATAGDLWARLPQLRLDVTHNFGDTSTLFQIGILRPVFGDPRLGDIPQPGTSLDTAFSGFGERASQPFYQARIAASHPFRGSTATIGLGGHFGEEAVGASRKIDSWAFAFDFHIPLQSRVTLRGEGFVGSNLAPFQGGIVQGVAAAPAAAPFTTIQPIGAGGGWGELTFRATEDNKNIFYFGAGTDDPRNHQLLPGSMRAKNTFAWVSYFRKLTNDVTLSLEWSNWQFRTVAFPAPGVEAKGPSGRGNVINIALAYQF